MQLVVPCPVLRPLISITARAIFLEDQIHKGTKKTLVPRPGRRSIRLCRRLLHLPQDPALGGPHLRHRRSIDGVLNHKGHRPAAFASLRRKVCGKPGYMEEQAGVPSAATGESRRKQC